MSMWLMNIQASRERRSQKKENRARRSESRREFEERLREEFREILAGRAEREEIRRREDERAREEAQEKLDRVMNRKTSAEKEEEENSVSHRPDLRRKTSSSDERTLDSLIRRTDSRIPEVMEAIHSTEKAGENLPRTISEVLSALSGGAAGSSSKGGGTSQNITEDLARELSSVSTAAEVDDETAFSSSRLESDGGRKRQRPPSSSAAATVVPEEEGVEEPSTASEMQTLAPSSSSISLPSESDGGARRLQLQQQPSSSTFLALSRRLEEESSAARRDYEALKRRETELVQRAKEELSRLEEKKKALRTKEGGEQSSSSSIKKRERAVLLELKRERAEVEERKEEIRAAERERKALMKQQREVLKKKDPPAPVTSSREDAAGSGKAVRGAGRGEPTVEQGSTGVNSVPKVEAAAGIQEDRLPSSSAATVVEEEAEVGEDISRNNSESEHSQGRSERILTPCSPSKMESLKRNLGTALRTPLSPKSGPSAAAGIVGAAPTAGSRRRHSSADSEDSVSLSHSEEHSSDIEIRINALRDELTRRMKTAARLKQQQRQKNRERMRAQEVTLKRQIEKYDKLIQEARTELEDKESAAAAAVGSQSSSSPPSIVPPQIKTPRQAIVSPSPGADAVLSRRLSLDEAVLSRSSTSAVTAGEDAPPLPSPLRSPVTESVSDEASIVAQEKRSSQSTSAQDVLPPPSPASVLPPPAADKTSVKSPDPPTYSDDFTSSNNASVVSEVQAVQKEVEQGKGVKERASTEKGRDGFADTVASEILDEAVADTCLQVREIRKEGAKKSEDGLGESEGAFGGLISSGGAGGANDGGAPLSSKPSSPKATTTPATRISRPSPQDLMTTTFDVGGSGSSEEDDKGEGKTTIHCCICKPLKPYC